MKIEAFGRICPRAWLACLAWSISIVLGPSAYATVDTERFIIPGVYDPSDAADTLAECHCANHDRVTVTCYLPDTAGNSICAGGGDFDKGAFAGGRTCHGSDGMNYGTIIVDADSECWYRKNFGLNGIVDARQCGVIGDGVAQDAGDLQQCLNLARDNAIPVVSTGGGKVRDDQNNGGGDYGQDVVVPGGVKLTCGGPPVGQVNNNNYTKIEHALYLAGGHTVRPANTSDGDGKDDGSGAAFDGCLLLRADEGGADPYAPSSFIPQNLRDSLKEVAAFRGTQCRRAERQPLPPGHQRALHRLRQCTGGDVAL